MRSITFVVALFISSLAVCQNGDRAERIYSASQNSVYLVYLNDANGNPSALGSAFLVAPHMLVTNAHVVDAGTPVLAVGPVRVPLTVVKIDEKNDLAILHVNEDLVAKPLVLSTETSSPGEQEFAVGNPEGLEKTISQGIVSGVRSFDGRQLVQITSPISHGSSGGPILNINGEVIGVAVGMLENGENLNFAVPVKYVRALMQEKSPASTATSLDCSQGVAALNELADRRRQETYSDDASSSYQQDTRELMSRAATLADGCHQPKVLQQLACLGTTEIDLSDSGIKAARMLVTGVPTLDSRALLAYVLYERALDEGFFASISKQGSPEEVSAAKENLDLFGQAQREALAVRNPVKGMGAYTINPFLVATYVLAGVKDGSKDYSGAAALDFVVAQSKATICGADLPLRAYRSLISEYSQLDNGEAAEKWFRLYASKYEPNPYEWDQEGDRRSAANDLQGAADAYERAASGAPAYDYDYCYAANDHYLQSNTDADDVLADGRKCVDSSVKDTNAYSQKQFQGTLPQVYRSMADVLEGRGVYRQALEYVKESISLAPANAFGLALEAKIFERLERYPECISAAQTAVQLSDGKYAFMQFRLGSCYFDSQDWSQAADSFRLAASEDTSDPVSAFNLGLSLQRQGYLEDAKVWFQEALRRNPDAELKEKILGLLQ